MPLNKPYIQTSNPYESVERKTPSLKSIFYGEVISIDDDTDGGRIKVNIVALDGVNAAKEDLPDCYPLLPKFFHVYPQVGEIVRIFIQDMKYPKKGRFWLGSIISQPQKNWVGFNIYCPFNNKCWCFTTRKSTFNISRCNWCVSNKR